MRASLRLIMFWATSLETEYMLITSSPIPLYYQVASVLRQNIYNDVYSAGDRLPSEEELAREFQVSRATLREAISQLVQAGELVRRHGLGTFVTTKERGQFSHVLYGDLESLVQAASANAHVAKQVEVTQNTEFPERVAAQLGLDPARGTLITRLMTMGDSPFAYHRNYLPSVIGKAITKRTLASVGVMRAIADTGREPWRAVQTIRAQAADPELGELLGVGPSGPLMSTERVLYDREDLPLEVVHSWYPAYSYSYQVTFERGRRSKT